MATTDITTLEIPNTEAIYVTGPHILPMAHEMAPDIASQLIEEQLHQQTPDPQFNLAVELNRRIYNKLSKDDYIVEIARPFVVLGKPVALLPIDRDPLPSPAKVFLFMPEASHDRGGTFTWLDWGTTRHHVENAMRETDDTQFIAATYAPHKDGYFTYSIVDHVEIQLGLMEGERAERLRLTSAAHANRPVIQSMDGAITARATALVQAAEHRRNAALVEGR